MMEEDYVDPAGGKPDIVAETALPEYTRETVVSDDTEETKKDEKVGETNLQVSLVDSSRSEPSQQDAPASSFLTSTPISFRLPSLLALLGIVTLPATDMPVIANDESWNRGKVVLMSTPPADLPLLADLSGLMESELRWGEVKVYSVRGS